MAKYNFTLDSTGPLITEDFGSWQGNTSTLLIAGEVPPLSESVLPYSLSNLVLI